MATKQVSVLAQFDDVCRGFNYFMQGADAGIIVKSFPLKLCDVKYSTCTLEFLKFAINQEECRRRWLEAEAELKRLQNQLNEVNRMNSKLELQYHHATVLLKNEIKVRTQVQEEKRNLV